MSQKKSQRSDNRRAAMQFLYAWEYNKPEVLDDAIRVFFESQESERSYFDFAELLIRGVIRHQDAIDAEISSLAINWSFDRIARVDLAILRIAVFELFYCEDIPPVVSINEAVELGKEFSKDDSKRFINGLLDRIKDKLGRPARVPGKQFPKGNGPNDVLEGLID